MQPARTLLVACPSAASYAVVLTCGATRVSFCTTHRQAPEPEPEPPVPRVGMLRAQVAQVTGSGIHQPDEPEPEPPKPVSPVTVAVAVQDVDTPSDGYSGGGYGSGSYGALKRTNSLESMISVASENIVSASPCPPRPRAPSPLAHSSAPFASSPASQLNLQLLLPCRTGAR